MSQLIPILIDEEPWYYYQITSKSTNAIVLDVYANSSAGFLFNFVFLWDGRIRVNTASPCIGFNCHEHFFSISTVMEVAYEVARKHFLECSEFPSLWCLPKSETSEVTE